MLYYIKVRRDTRVGWSQVRKQGSSGVAGVREGMGMHLITVHCIPV